MIRKGVLISILAIISHICMAQWSEDELKPYRQKADKEVLEYVNQMVQKGKWDQNDDELEIGFTTDTMRINLVVRFLEDDGKYSTMEMHQTLSFQMTEYDKLLNKYYRKLLDKLTEEDKVKVREAQRTWLKYRDSEFKINREIIAPNSYMGGGTMWPLVASGRSLDIIKERVFSLYHLITNI